jgi:hypothetical protein
MSGWNYFLGNSALDKKNTNQAITYYKKVKKNDRYYLPSQYQLALSYISSGQPKNLIKAEGVLTSLLLIKQDSKEDIELVNSAHIALARLFYQEKKFKKSFTEYRLVSKGSSYFYDSLYEQSWAFFMSGYPNHTLGALHSVNSPFFANRDNPEAKILEALTYFWLCNYQQSHLALSSFLDSHKETAKELKSILGRRNLNADLIYEMFENNIAGVSSDALGISKSVFHTAMIRPSVMYYRSQLADLMNEKKRFSNLGLYGFSKEGENIQKILNQEESKIQGLVGQEILLNLKDINKNYQNLLKQGEFLRLELLMSRKEKYLGKELHASNKMVVIRSKKDIRGWQQSEGRSWAPDKKQEYWWDEIGFYIYSEKSQCLKSQTSL